MVFGFLQHHRLRLDVFLDFFHFCRVSLLPLTFWVINRGLGIWRWCPPRHSEVPNREELVPSEDRRSSIVPRDS